MNLIPNKPGVTPNYYCTWSAQNSFYNLKDDPDAFAGAGGAGIARDSINEETVFGEKGMAHIYEKVRGDLYFVLDDGWDIPYGLEAASQRYEFGSLLLNEARFPECAGAPKDRLAKINQKLKDLGWRGVGLWVASQAHGEKDEESVLQEDAFKTYWTKRMEWCKDAGIYYWKVDWGYHESNNAWREALSALGRDQYPELWIEQCRCIMPVNEDEGRFGYPRYIMEVLAFSDVFRSYDVLSQLSVATTLDRLGVLLQGELQAQAKGIINCEDELYMGAALGCSVGVMRNRGKMDEVIRAIRWHRIAPPFSIRDNQTYLSEELGTDKWYLKPGECWAEQYTNKEISQTAPLVISRGIALPVVEGKTEEKPFVVAAGNPNGAVSIATLARHQNGTIETPRCIITLDVGNSDVPIGIFGKYDKLTLKFDHPIRDKQVWAQDLMGDEAVDITNDVLQEDTTITIPGEVIDRIGLSCRTMPSDGSDPGIVLVLR